MVLCQLIPIILEALLTTLAIVGMNCLLNLLSEHVLLEPGLDRILLVKVSTFTVKRVAYILLCVYACVYIRVHACCICVMFVLC